MSNQNNARDEKEFMELFAKMFASRFDIPDAKLPNGNFPFGEDNQSCSGSCGCDGDCDCCERECDCDCCENEDFENEFANDKQLFTYGMPFGCGVIMDREAKEFFEKMFGVKTQNPTFVTKNTHYGATNIVKNETEYVISMMLPGFNKEDISVSYLGKVLTVEAKSTIDENNDKVSETIKKEYHSVKNIKKNFTLENVLYEQTKIEYSNGVLTIKVPIEPTETPKQINF